MIWLLMALLAGYTLLLPVDLIVQIHHHRTTHSRLTLRLAFLRKSWKITGFPAAKSALGDRRSQRFLSALRRSVMARRFLRNHTQLVRLDALLILSTCDAARTAVLTGFLRSAAGLLPLRQARICVQPDFFRAHSTVDFRCIIRWKLGTLLLTAWLLLAETLHQQRLTESEAT